MTPQDIIARLADFCVLAEEVQLADFGETAGGGPFIKLRLADADQLQEFRGRDRATRTRQGQRYHILMIEISDDETLVNNKERTIAETAIIGGPISKNSDVLARDPEFFQFVRAHDQDLIDEGVAAGMKSEDICRSYIRSECKVRSRAELDHNEVAKLQFEKLKSDFVRWTHNN